uniref:Uncharacterized protein n=1 Tax=Anguilla anguilla TaxID=7936 RepID=A0A0E9SRB9_ANGAN
MLCRFVVDINKNVCLWTQQTWLTALAAMNPQPAFDPRLLFGI